MAAFDQVWEPVERWRSELRDKHADLVAARFDALLAQSGVDAEANAGLCSTIHALEGSLEKAKKVLARFRTASRICAFAFFASSAVAAICACMTLLAAKGGGEKPDLPAAAWIALAVCIVASGSLWRRVFAPRAKKAGEKADAIARSVAEETEKAWRQMEPLNALFDWSIPAEIAHETMPALEIDPVFSVGRLRDLADTFGLDENVLGGRSILGTASGEIAGSPFVLADAISQKWGEKTYTGSRTIHWTERVKGPDGKSHTVVRTETLVATVTKPLPIHERAKFLIFGNPAAPDLSFSRDPSPLSGRDPSERATRRAMEKEEARLEALARKMDPANPFTMMANHDFEVLVHATNRSHPVQFRLLYTPLAQQQTVTLLRDRAQGWGDDFSLRKEKMVSIVDAAHLTQADIDTSPERYRSWELAKCREKFTSFCNDWFKHLYFALSPMLCVPLYQQTRTHDDIYKTGEDRAAAPQELEAAANAFGEKHFRHPDSATLSLLKVRVDARSGGETSATVVAHGFRTEERVDVVSKWGGDGRCHDVEVHWLEYLPVQRETPMSALDATSRPRAWETPEANPSAAEAWREAFRRWNPAELAAFRHRATVSRFG